MCKEERRNRNRWEEGVKRRGREGKRRKCANNNKLTIQLIRVYPNSDNTEINELGQILQKNKLPFGHYKKVRRHREPLVKKKETDGLY